MTGEDGPAVPAGSQQPAAGAHTAAQAGDGDHRHV